MKTDQAKNQAPEPRKVIPLPVCYRKTPAAEWNSPKPGDSEYCGTYTPQTPYSPEGEKKE
jgi:hypothetical protein